MKQLLFASLLICLGLNEANAQAPFTTMDSVDINNINAAVLVHGDMWWNPVEQVAHCYFPANAPTSINFAGALWMSGYDGSGALHVTAQTYRQTGNDYWPGPLDSSDTLTYATSQSWAKIWKVNRSDIQYFEGLTTHTTANTPVAILTWPAKGNANAAGNGSAALTITNDMAPFVDLNGNGIYEPLLGEYPDVPGDQALWWVFSDNGPAHTQTNGKPLDVEVHAMAYGYSRGTLIDNVVYYDYTIINRSSNTYSNFRLSQFDDMDLGYYDDDFIGFDSVRRMGIDYNGTEDDGAVGGHPLNSYGTDMPIAGLTMIVLPGDAGTGYVPLGSFVTFNNDASPYGNPTSDTQYAYYMRAENRLGLPFTNTFQGPGVPCLTQGSGTATNYLYTGDPSNSAQWSECGCGNAPGDRRFVLSSNDFTFSPGSQQHIVMALMTTNLHPNNGCPTATFDSIEAVADTAWNIYYNPLQPSQTPVIHLSAENTINIFPNPASDQLNIVGNLKITDVAITNIVGQVIYDQTSNADELQVNVADLPAGVYLVRINNSVVRKFVKQ